MKDPRSISKAEIYYLSKHSMCDLSWTNLLVSFSWQIQKWIPSLKTENRQRFQIISKDICNKISIFFEVIILVCLNYWIHIDFTIRENSINNRCLKFWKIVRFNFFNVIFLTILEDTKTRGGNRLEMALPLAPAECWKWTISLFFHVNANIKFQLKSSSWTKEWMGETSNITK